MGSPLGHDTATDASESDYVRGFVRRAVQRPESASTVNHGKHNCGLQSQDHHAAAGDHRDVPAVAHQLGLADPEGRIHRGDRRLVDAATQANVDRAVDPFSRQRGVPGLVRVRRHQHGQVRGCA